jgi:hypothetical protein
MASAVAFEIPREQWQAYFDDLGRVYSGWSVTVELLLGELGDEKRIDDLPLKGLSYERRGSQAGDLMIEAGEANLSYEVHLVHDPRAVRASLTIPGGEIDLEI